MKNRLPRKLKKNLKTMGDLNLYFFRLFWKKADEMTIGFIKEPSADAEQSVYAEIKQKHLDVYGSK